MKNNTPIFRGIATALITPLTADGIDYAQFGKLIDWQIDQGINALVICGTTGESSTLSDAEHRRAIAFACEKVNGRVPVIAGTGSNETAYAVELTKSACADGADAVLVVTPYYNKTTQNGLVAMYNTIADASTKPDPVQRPLPHRHRHPAGDLCQAGPAPQHCRHQGGQQRHLQDRGDLRPGGGPAGHLLRQ